VPEKLTSNNKDEKRWWNYNALIFKCSCKVWTHFHKFVFYALFKSAAQFAILGRQKGLSRRRKGEGETRAYYRTYLIFHAQINAMKTHQLTRLAVNASVGIDTVWLDLHINCFWHRLFAELPSTYNSQILFFSIHHHRPCQVLISLLASVRKSNCRALSLAFLIATICA